MDSFNKIKLIVPIVSLLKSWRDAPVDSLTKKNAKIHIFMIIYNMLKIAAWKVPLILTIASSFILS